jgi:CRISPR-associated protein Cas2
MVVEHVTPSLRGELTRWFLEPKAGVFVGEVSGMVRDRLWEKVCGASRGGGCILIHSSGREQGFAVRTWGDTSRQVVDFEGLTLVRMPLKP